VSRVVRFVPDAYDDVTVIFLKGDEVDALNALMHGAAQAGLLDTLPELVDLRTRLEKSVAEEDE
jgi:hypothetical protein